MATPHLRARAWADYGAGYCFIKDAEGARIAYDETDASGRKFLKVVCAKHGITVP